MEADHFGHDVGGDPIVRRLDAGQIRLEFAEPPVGAQQGPRAEPGGQHALHHQHPLGDHQPFAGGQVGAAVDAVQIAEVVEPRVGRIGHPDVDDCAHALSSTMAEIRSAASISVLRWALLSVSSRCPATPGGTRRRL